MSLTLSHVCLKKEAFSISDVSLSIDKGITAIVGKSGSGKTTLLSLIAGLQRPDSGTVEKEGSIGMVFQFPERELFAETVLKDVSFSLHNADDKKAREALDALGVEERLWNLSPFSLSGGERRKVAIAGILASEPDIIMMDEPSAGLDADGQESLRKLLFSLRKKGKIVVITTHDVSLAAIADRVIVIENGSVVADDIPQAVISTPAMRLSQALGLGKIIDEELLADIKSFEGHYKTVVIDTCGALIELMKDWAMRTEPSASKKSGGFSQQGYGIVKSEFLRLSAELRKKFNVVFLFHATKDKQGDDVFYDIVCEGSTKTLVWQPADLGAYLHIINGERYLGFTPTMNYNAKSAYGIKGLVKVPELKDGEPNDFLTRLFAQVQQNLKAEHDSLKPQQDAYDAAMAQGKALIEKLSKPEEVFEVSNAIKALPHALTSERELKAALSARIKDLGFTYNREKKTYELAQA